MNDKTNKKPKIYITNPVTILRLLRNFGHMLKHIYINFDFFDAKFCAEIEWYLAEYCSESLSRLSLRCNSSKILFEHLHKPLANVRTVGIYVYENQKLTHLQFNEKYLPRLKYLYMSNESSRVMHYSDPIHFENIEYFLVRTYAFCRFAKFPLTFAKLKHLVFMCFMLNDEWCSFVGNIQHLMTLEMYRIGENPLLGKMFELPNFLSNIEELVLDVNPYMLADDFLRFLEKSRALKTLTLIIDNAGGKNMSLDARERVKKLDDIVKPIVSQLDSKWKFNIINPFTHPYQGTDVYFRYYCYVIERV